MGFQTKYHLRLFCLALARLFLFSINGLVQWFDRQLSMGLLKVNGIASDITQYRHGSYSCESGNKTLLLLCKD